MVKTTAINPKTTPIIPSKYTLAALITKVIIPKVTLGRGNKIGSRSKLKRATIIGIFLILAFNHASKEDGTLFRSKAKQLKLYVTFILNTALFLF